MSDRKWVGEPMEGEYDFLRTNNRLTNGLTEGNACVSRRIRRPILESHDTRDRCQSVDFRHAFLELRPDRIREVAAHTRVYSRIQLPRAARVFCRFVEKRSERNVINTP